MPRSFHPATLGWSLGALNAFNLAWQYPEVFGTVGGLSPSFWLSRDRTDASASLLARTATPCAVSAAVALVLLLGGLAYFRRTEATFADKI